MREGQQLSRDREEGRGGWCDVRPEWTAHTAGVQVCVPLEHPGGSVQLAVGFCVALVLLVDENLPRHAQDSHYAQVVPSYELRRNRFAFSKQAIAELPVPFLFVFPLVWRLTLLFNLQTGAVLPEEHFYLHI